MKRIVALILAALIACLAPACADADRNTVKAVQQALNDAGYDCGAPDGLAGKRTAAAITAYQADHGLAATGVVDDALLAALGLAPEAAAASGEAADADGLGYTAGELYDGLAFREAWYALFSQRILSDAEDPESEETQALLRAYHYEKLLRAGIDFHSLYADRAMTRYARPGSITLSLFDREDAIDTADYVAAVSFLELVSVVYGGSEDELRAILDSWLPAAPSNGEGLSTADWGMEYLTVLEIVTEIMKAYKDLPRDEYQAKLNEEWDKRWRGDFPLGKCVIQFYRDNAEHCVCIQALDMG